MSRGESVNPDQLAEDLTDHATEEREKDVRAFPPISRQTWRNRRWLIERGRRARAEEHTLNVEPETLNRRKQQPGEEVSHEGDLGVLPETLRVRRSSPTRKKAMSKLQHRYEKEADIPAELRGFYVESSGAFILDADDIVPKADAEHLQNRLTHMEVEFGEKKAEYEKSVNTVIEERKRLETEIAELKKNRGSGATPNVTNGPGHVPDDQNPFMTGNITQQSDLYSRDKEEYKRLKKHAWSKGAIGWSPDLE